MRKRVLFLLTFLIGLNAYSQIAKKTIMFGGYIYGNFSNQKSNSDYYLDRSKSYSLYFGPELNYFVKDNFSMGIMPQFSISSSKYSFSSMPEYFSKSLGGGLSLKSKKYFGVETIKPFVGLSVVLSGYYETYNSLIFDPVDGTYTSENQARKELYFTPIASCGIAYFVNPKVSIDFLIEYSHSFIFSNEESSDNKFTSINKIYLGTGISVIL